MKINEELLKDIGFEKNTNIVWGEYYFYSLEKSYPRTLLTEGIRVYSTDIGEMDFKELFKKIKEYHEKYYYSEGKNKTRYEISNTLKSIINYRDEKYNL